MVDWVGPRSHVLDGIQVKFGVKWGGAVEPRVYRENVVSAVQKRWTDQTVLAGEWAPGIVLSSCVRLACTLAPHIKYGWTILRGSCVRASFLSVDSRKLLRVYAVLLCLFVQLRGCICELVSSHAVTLTRYFPQQEDNDRLRGPGRADRSGVCVCVCVFQYVIFDLDIWRTHSPGHYLGRVERSRSPE